MPSNPLTNLLEQYNSESDDEDGQQLNHKNKNERLDKKVDDFLKEIQHIAPNNGDSGNGDEIGKNVSLWQECFDESSGYPYYWHTQTNQVTWEIPKELELSRKANNQNIPQSLMHSTAYEAQRCHLAANTYNKIQDKLPEGMIPKEVVERCKNRYRDKKQKVPKVQNKSQVNIDKIKGSDSDDGPIEMITSFGSDDSESDTEETVIKSRNSPVNDNTTESINAIDSKRSELRIGPSLPQFHITSNAQDNSKDIDEKNNKMKNEKLAEEQRLKFSLVPGYADDSDNDDDASPEKNQRKTLFPISEFDDSHSGSIKKFKVQNIVESVDSNNTNDEKKSSKIEEIISKGNKFLETTEAPAKAFQRKRRIAFDVRPKNDPKINQNDVINDNQINSELIRGNDERLGLGFAKNSSSIVDNNDENANTNDSDKKSVESEKNENSIAFVKGEVLNLPQASTEKCESEKIAMKEEIDMILEKLKFLSEGFQTVSAVQIMIIQLQTLLTAWEAGDLKDRYLENWLSETSSELCRLEKAAAPSGWNCQWDRSHRRYYYQNESTGETRWNYPDVIGGAEEMELCTTPPPADNEIEENKMITNQIVDASKSDVMNKDDKTPESDVNTTKATESTDVSKEMVPPPPPKISSPSPPPPPRINADDLKKGKKQKTDCDTEKTMIDDKNMKETVETPMTLPTLVGSEPLPPGVDSPEISFPLAGAHQSIEPTVIFATTQQPSNQPSMYATAAMQDPTSVSIIGHHPALLQSQLVHYPAYHQHLHNQAIIAAANRLTGQDTVQFVLDFPRIYTNTQVIAKPPITTNKESLGSAINSFYNDIASLERPALEEQPKPVQSPQLIAVEPQPVPTIPEVMEKSSVIGANDLAYKDKRKKKVKNLISKKHKQVSSMVAKWQKAQNYEGSH